jgi:hypothetical protein
VLSVSAYGVLGSLMEFVASSAAASVIIILSISFTERGWYVFAVSFCGALVTFIHQGASICGLRLIGRFVNLLVYILCVLLAGLLWNGFEPISHCARTARCCWWRSTPSSLR